MLRFERIAVFMTCAAALACGSAQRQSVLSGRADGRSQSRIEQRSLSDRPPLAIIERQGDPEAAIGFASLASEAPELHAELGQLMSERLTRAGFQTQLVAHGLGFELTLLADRPERAKVALAALLRALQKPVTQSELGRLSAPDQPQPNASSVALCSAELVARRRSQNAALLERERLAAFARDRSALSIVGDAATAAAVADALEAGPDWPERGAVPPRLPDRAATQVLRGDKATLSLALTVGDPNRALEAAARLGEPRSALGPRLAALGAGLRLRRVTATAHPVGACLRIDSDVDASPLPEPRRLGFALQALQEEAELALAATPEGNWLEATALGATDPRAAARAAAYHSLVTPAPELPRRRLVALTAPDGGLAASSLEQAMEQARSEPVALETQLQVEAGQAGLWALVAIPCAASSERAESAGHAALFLSAASAGAPSGVRLEPWIGPSGVGLLGFVERARGESDAEAAARLGDALGQALVAPPAALDVASARSELIKNAGGEPHPLLESLLETLVPGHVGALAPRGNVSSLQAATREAVLSRQRELMRLPHRLALLSPSSAADAQQVATRLSRWLRSPDATRPSPCHGELGPPARSELSLAKGATDPEGSYLAFRIPARAGAEASLLAEILNLPGGALERSLAEPELVGAARALVFGSSSARALVIQLSAFEGREAEALSRVQKLFERLAAGGVLSAAEVETATARQASAHRLAALDPRYRLLRLLDPPALPADAAALRRFASSLRPESAVVARSVSAPAPVAPASSGKAAPAR